MAEIVAMVHSLLFAFILGQIVLVSCLLVQLIIEGSILHKFLHDFTVAQFAMQWYETTEMFVYYLVIVKPS